MNETTDKLEHITSTYCKDDEEVKVVTEALKEALALYQWEYQEATDRAKRDITDQLDSALMIVKEHLAFLGQDTLIENLEDAFDSSTMGLNQTNILKLAKKHMKSYCMSTITTKRYNEVFAKNMSDAFIEWSKEYPLYEAPAHYDMNFESSL